MLKLLVRRQNHTHTLQVCYITSRLLQCLTQCEYCANRCLLDYLGNIGERERLYIFGLCVCHVLDELPVCAWEALAVDPTGAEGWPAKLLEAVSLNSLAMSLSLCPLPYHMEQAVMFKASRNPASESQNELFLL